ncbi:hypothetical protein PVAP13_1KG450700 [Panicum virgatum]|uniref:Uncharacterized protein n=1 Tax=Panicum virgatum TaxID=38727 RepID=A0A8T0XNK4_PANVG|nr:hypothetical protein PVAP13_1KG450700 [Panicum virgatum]
MVVGESGGADAFFSKYEALASSLPARQGFGITPYREYHGFRSPRMPRRRSPRMEAAAVAPAAGAVDREATDWFWFDLGEESLQGRAAAAAAAAAAVRESRRRPGRPHGCGRLLVRTVNEQQPHKGKRVKHLSKYIEAQHLESQKHNFLGRHT